MNTLILVATTLVSLSAFSTAIAQLSALDDSMRIQVDNDLFAAGGSHDRDYTGGVAITFSGPDVQHNVLSLSSALNLIDALFIPQGSRGMTADALQTGLMFFTPADITTSTPVSNDRPYASLVFLANGRISVDVDSRHAWSSNFTVGVLGLSLAGRVHSTIHEVTGSEPVRGYRNQVSAGGELTARYALARHRLWMANAANTMDVKTSIQGDVRLHRRMRESPRTQRFPARPVP